MRRFGIVASSVVLSQQSTFTGILDDNPGAALAGGVRRLYSSYSGPLIQVIRESDSAVQDIGYDSNGDLDTAALTSFCTGTNGYALQVYDQSGNAYNWKGYASGSSLDNLPLIYTGGSVVTLGGVPAIQIVHPRFFQWTQTGASMSEFMTGGASGGDKRVTIHFVGQQGNTADVYKLWIDEGTANEYLTAYVGGNELMDFNGTSVNFGLVLTRNTQMHFMWQVEGASWRLYATGSLINTQTNNSAQTPTTTNPNINIGSNSPFNSARSLDGYIQELIIWPTAVSSSGLWSNVNTYYSIS